MARVAAVRHRDATTDMQALLTTKIPSAAFAALLATLAVLAGANPAAAHGSHEGIAALIDDQRVIVTAAVAFEQLGFTDTSGDGVLDETEFVAQHEALAASLVETTRDNVDLTVDGEPIEIIGAGVPGAQRRWRRVSGFGVCGRHLHYRPARW